METTSLPANPSMTVDFKQAFEALPQTIALLSVPDFQYLAVTDLYCAVTFYDRSRLIGLPIIAFLPERPNTNNKSLLRLEKSLQQVVRTKKPHNLGIFRFDLPSSPDPKSNLVERWWRVMNVPVLDATREVAYILHVVEDVDHILDALSELEYAAMLRVRGDIEADSKPLAGA